jgi:RHS repeat-associated protein
LGGYRAERAAAFEPGRLRQWVYLPDSFEPLALQVGTLTRAPAPATAGKVSASSPARTTALVTEGIGQGVGERGNERHSPQPHDTAYSASASLDTQRPATALHSGEYQDSSAGSFSLYWYQNDPNGCPVRLLSSTGEVLWAASYTAWAEVDLLHAALIDNPIRLQGQYADAETGLSYNRHRYFCPHAGQFISQDPLGLSAGIHPYQMAPSSLGWLDPLGLAKCRTNKAAKKPNLNSNDATSNFGIYEIMTPAGLEKIGKADLNRVTQSSGLPTRLHQQVRKLEKVYGKGNVIGTVVEDLGETTTGTAKAAENARIKKYFDETGRVPRGNQKSYKP